MEITHTFKPNHRADWRQWLQDNHQTATEVWLVFETDDENNRQLTYLDSVEEALCFGWIDGIVKKINDRQTAQRFTPRKSKSHWTELNKERVRRLVKLGLMTDAGLKVAPSLEIAELRLPALLQQTMENDAELQANFAGLPDLYKRIRINYIHEAEKDVVEYDRRLQKFIQQTKLNKLFGGWDDGGKLIDY